MTDPVGTVPGDDPAPLSRGPRVFGDAQGRPWSLWAVAAGAVIAMAGSLAFGEAYAAVDGLKTIAARTASFGYTAFALVGIWTGFLGVPYFLSRTRGTGSLRSDFGLTAVLPRDLGWGAVIGLLGQVMVYVVYLPVVIFDPSAAKKLSDPAKALTATALGWDFLPLAFLIVICAPIVEELFFRGLALRSFGSRWGAKAGICGSAVLFGLVHFEALQTPALILFGVFLGVSAQRNGRLGTNIFAHMTFNAVTMATLALSR